MQISQSIRRFLERLGPYQALLVLAVPLAIIEPLKVLALLVVGDGHFIAGTLVMIGAYAGSLFVTERLFRVLKPKLLTLPWFAGIWSWFVTARDKTLAWLQMDIRSKVLFEMSALDPGIEPPYEARTKESRLSATFVLLSVLICALVAHALAPSAAAIVLKNGPVREQPAGTVRIVDPAYCANQTWPYIDERCLKRADTPERTATATQADTASSAATSPVGNPVSRVIPTATGSEASPPTVSRNAARQEGRHDSGPSALGAADQSNAVATTAIADSPMSYRVTESSRHRHGRSRRYYQHSFIGFGFR
jgi:hypothetical protein